MRVTQFGKLIRKLRIDTGIVLKDMAEMIGVSSAYLSSIELGKKNITTKIIESICSAYALSEIERQELEKAAEMSQPSIKLDLRNHTETERNAVSVFARKYRELDSDEHKKLMELLEG
jgi:transcriptional regulator with XRE-family HTH domain